jgi:hypothetical protein
VTVAVGGGVVLKAARGGDAIGKGSSRFVAAFFLFLSSKAGTIQFKGQHVYDRQDLTRDLQLDEMPRGAAHQLWPSDIVDTFEASSTIGSFTMYHHRTISAFKYTLLRSQLL